MWRNRVAQNEPRGICAQREVGGQRGKDIHTILQSVSQRPVLITRPTHHCASVSIPSIQTQFPCQLGRKSWWSRVGPGVQKTEGSGTHHWHVARRELDAFRLAREHQIPSKIVTERRVARERQQ